MADSRNSTISVGSRVRLKESTAIDGPFQGKVLETGITINGIEQALIQVDEGAGFCHANLVDLEVIGRDLTS